MTDLGPVVTFRFQFRHTGHNEHHGYLSVTELCQRPCEDSHSPPIDRHCPIFFIRVSEVAASTLTTLTKFAADMELDSRPGCAAGLHRAYPQNTTHPRITTCATSVA